MQYFSRLSPVRAYLDLRRFLATRERYELGFLALSVAITGFLIFAFARDSRVERPYKRDIVYVQQWSADRTDAEIKAQQAIDAPIKAKRLKAEADAREAKRQSFKKMDDAMKRWGL